MSNSIFQGVMQQLKTVSGRTFGVIDSEGCVVSCTEGGLLGERWPDAALRVISAGDQTVTFGQKTFRAIVSSTNTLEYAAFCSGDDELLEVTPESLRIRKTILNHEKRMKAIHRKK